MTMLDIPAPASRKLPPEVYTTDEIARLIKACSTRAATGVRNRALIITLYRGGLRLAEALALRPKDLDRAGGTVRILHGKGDKSRTIGMDDGAFAMIERWLDTREKLGIGARSPVFCTLKGEEIMQQYIRILFPRLARKADVHKRVHAHGMRHTHASELASEGVELITISEQLGHASVATTDRYVRHLAPQRVIETMRARSFNLEGVES